MDPVESLFHDLPRPEQHPPYCEWEEPRTIYLSQRAIYNFTSRAESFQPTDDDYDFISRCARLVMNGAIDVHQFYNQLASLALSKQLPEHDQSEKAQRLRDYKWIALGKKDEDSPFLTPDLRPHISEPISHASLPPVQYVADFQETQLRQRGLVLQHLLTHLYKTAYTSVILRIERENNRHVVQCGSPSRYRFQDFPRHLCSSPDQEEAVLFAMKCNDALDIHQPLIELILRRKYSNSPRDSAFD